MVRHLTAHQLPHLVDDVSLVASELATNAVEHAHTAFVVALKQADGSVVLTVIDGSALSPIRGHPDELDVSGRGSLFGGLIESGMGHAPQS